MNQTNKFTYEDIVLAFAGITQAAVLIQQLASFGECDEEAFQASIASIYKIDAPNVRAIYGGIGGLRLGLTHLKMMFATHPKTENEKQQTRQLLRMIHAERQLYRRPALLTALKKKVHYAESQADFFTLTHPAVISSLSKIYEDTIGSLRFKIMIVGQRELLTNPDIMKKIRALLLAGIRSAVLWQQVGGSRWQLLFSRRCYRAALEKSINLK